ncbi:transglycosylase domain-containing protein [Blautia producta]|uniref:transglycosylase domain-containing protein n=1 Tax=Blautia producta TaxID=33035 RepID=UPI001FA829E7|nr:biosynthetic peptidoglycan transglycosylase [Blautia coccoides]
MTEKPINERVEEIRGVEGFTSYSELPQFYIDATISVEDHRFAKHCGIDLIAIGRAAWTDIRAISFVEGGSTITQQLAKNMLFTQDKKIERKAAEVFAALDMESKYTKEEIFELYANTVYFGG